jgi:hypothetical protein
VCVFDNTVAHGGFKLIGITASLCGQSIQQQQQQSS